MTVFIFGWGYAARVLATLAPCVGTRRVPVDAPPLYAFDGIHPLSTAGEKVLAEAENVLVSIPPDAEGCPVFRLYGEKLAAKNNLKWLGYFSSTAVYGDAKGEWVDETTPPAPQTEAGHQRLKAEEQWCSFNLPLHVFRLSGIYGPGRSALERARHGAPIIEKPGHVMNRIHVADIAQAVATSIECPRPGEIYNLADDTPASSADVLREAYRVLGLSAPEPIPFEAAELSPMGRGFFESNKRIRNIKLKEKLGVKLKYPSFREGLQENS